MAKKAAAPDPSMALAAMVNQVKLHKVTSGVRIPNFVVRWLLQFEVWAFGSIIQLVGKEAAGKSIFGMWLCALFVRAGGWAFIIDTEFKTDIHGTLRAVVGDDVYNSPRFSYDTAGSVNVAAGAGKNKLDEATAFLVGWQTKVMALVDFILDPKHLERRVLPVVIFVDSILGSASSELMKAIDKAQGTTDGRNTAGMSCAKSIGEWLTMVKGRLAQTNACIVFTNHLKKEVSLGGAPSNVPPADKYSGGTELNHSCQAVIKFSKCGKSKLADITGGEVRLSLMKNSFGDDSRAVKVWFFGDVQRDKDGVPIDEDGYGVMRLRWDWDGAFVNSLLKNFCLEGGDGASCALRDILPDLSIEKGRVKCKELGIDMPIKEFHAHVMNTPTLYQRFMKHPRTLISHTPDGPGVFVSEPEADSCTILDLRRASDGEELESESEGDGSSALAAVGDRSMLT